MKLGIVIGKTWATRKVKELEGCQLFILQPITSNGNIDGTPIVAADPENIAASGDVVVYVTSTDASQAFKSGYAPVNTSIVQRVEIIE